MLYVYPDGNIGDPESDREALKEAIKILTKEKIKENNMKNFIEVTCMNQKILINVNHIIKVTPFTESTQKMLEEFKESDEWKDLLDVFGGGSKEFAKMVEVAVDEGKVAKSIITITSSTSDKTTSINAREDYELVKKLIEEAI